MLGTSQSWKPSAAGRPRQVRLRSACSECCAAKVKCSGEKTGCERCRNAGTECVYVESRVGKVQGPRRKSKHADSNEPQHQQNNRPTLPAGQPRSLIAVALGDEFQGNDQDGIMRWSSDWQLAPSDTSSPAEFGNNSSNITEPCQNAPDVPMCPSPEGFAMSAIDPSLENFLLEFPVPQDSFESTDTAYRGAFTPPSTELRPRTEADSQCCVDCCHIIADLETYIMSDLRSFKIILGIVRTVLQKLTPLVDLQQGSGNLRCLLLFKTLMYQILELLEACLKDLVAEKTRERQRSLTGGGSGLGLGDFLIDAEEQSTLRIQTVLKEARRVTGLLNKLKSLAADLGPVSGGTARSDCYLDLEDRFRDLEARFTP